MQITRKLNINQLVKKKSHFLFGPRATGKSYLIDQTLKDEAFVIDLLEGELYTRLLENTSKLPAMILAQEKRLVVIDEVQRVPELLNEVHRLIEKEQIHFLLTGSSARKLKRHSVNLLAGRARQAELFPLTYYEYPNFELNTFLLYGGLPNIALSDEPYEDLDAYVSTYLEQEIKAEALVHKLPAFNRFLQLAAMTSSETLNFANLASDVSVSTNTLKEYYQILEDTFLGFMVMPWQYSVKRKSIATAKFYLFDTGVRNRLIQVKKISDKTDYYGQLFEHFIAMELRAYISYARKKYPLCFWRTQAGHEVDFVVGDEVAIEVKSTEKVSNKHLKGLRLLMEENKIQSYYLVSKDPIALKEDNIFILHWEQFLKKLWAGEIF